MKKTIDDIQTEQKRVLMRADFNVPLEDGQVMDDYRIQAAVPTIRRLIHKDSCLILCSHLDRPGGEVVEDLRLDPIADRLSNILEQEVKKVEDCIGRQVEEAASSMQPGEVLLLENTRFHKGEKSNDPVFAMQLAGLGEIFVNDAFAAAHRAHASTVGVTRYLPAVAGLLMASELEALEKIRQEPEHPLALIFGGAKTSDKIQMLEKFVYRAETLMLGGGMANTFLKAKGVQVGKSLVEEDSLDTAARIMDETGDKLLLPEDVVIARDKNQQADRRTVQIDQIPEDWMIVDIGPQTVDLYQSRLPQANSVIWNGPMGIFEVESFAEGTYAIARALAELDAETVVGGGETAAAVRQVGVEDQLTHVSTGGGAFMSFLEGKELPAVAALQDKE